MNLLRRVLGGRQFHSTPRLANLVPIVIEREEGTLFERSMDIYSRMLKDRVVFLSGPIDDYISRTIVAQLLFLESQDAKRPIELYINSPGGMVSAGMAIYDTMQFINCPVHTTAVGQAYSMGSILLAGGEPGQRRALKHTKVMIHQPLGGAQGSAADVEIHVRELMKTKTMIEQILSLHTGRTIQEIADEMHRDRYFTASEAKAFSLIDEVIIKRPTVSSTKGSSS